MDIFSLNVITYLIFNAFDYYTTYRFMGIFFNRNNTNRLLEFALFFIFYIVNSSFYLIYNNPFVNLTTSILGLFFITFIYKGKFQTSVIAVFSNYLLSMIWEIIPYVILLDLNIFEIGLSKALSSICMFTTVLLIERAYSFKSSSKLNWIHLISTLSISVGSIIIIILAYLSDYSEKSTLTIVSVLLYINIMVFYLYDVVNKYYSNLLEIQLLEKQNSIYKNQIDIISDTQKEIKIMKHDMKNHMLSFVSMLKKEQTFKALDYVYNILDSINASGNFVDTGNTEIDSLLNYKILEAKKNQILVNTSIIIPEKLNIHSLDISAIIGNLMDNSIEAVKKCDDKKIDISIELERGILYITIKNPYKGKIKKKNDRYLTDKASQKNHGLGLLSIEKSILKYDGSMEICSDNGLFIVDIMLYN